MSNDIVNNMKLMIVAKERLFLFFVAEELRPLAYPLNSSAGNNLFDKLRRRNISEGRVRVGEGRNRRDTHATPGRAAK